MNLREDEYYEHSASMLIDGYERVFEKKESEIDRLNKSIDIIPDDALSILDIGSHGGTFLDMLETKRECFVVGLERSSVAIQISKQHHQGTIIQGDAAALPFDNKSFDAITALEVIEHLPYRIYEQALLEMERVARKYLIISVPYREERLFVKCPYCGCNFSAWYHLRSFDYNRLSSLFHGSMLTKTEYINPKIEPKFSGIFRKIYRRFKKRFPDQALCPACGFKKEATQVRNQNTSNPLKFLDSKGSLIPKKIIYARIICVYEIE
jgi:ubiquinone/menaquinone biosynthesis C-methylase UbiE